MIPIDILLGQYVRTREGSLRSLFKSVFYPPKYENRRYSIVAVEVHGEVRKGRTIDPRTKSSYPNLFLAS